MTYEITRFKKEQTHQVVSMILSIQNGEAGLNLGLVDQPDLIDIDRSYENGGFWVATVGEEVIGTIALIGYQGRGAIKRFFVAAPFRGAGVANALMQTAVVEARGREFSELFLDTPAAAKRSHRFYAKIGFEPMRRNELPRDYAFPDRDSLLLRLRI